jgi:hypothetical protein
MNKYKINGKNYYSVTHFTAIPDKSPALIPWAVRTALDYFANHQDDCFDDLYNFALGAYKEKSKEAMKIGSEVHNILNLSFLTKVRPSSFYDCLNPQINNCIKAFESFELNYKPKWISSEEIVVNVKQKYAGTLDRIAEIDGKIYCIDFKTSNAIYDEYWLQVCAYAYEIGRAHV